MIFLKNVPYQELSVIFQLQKIVWETYILPPIRMEKSKFINTQQNGIEIASFSNDITSFKHIDIVFGGNDTLWICIFDNQNSGTIKLFEQSGDACILRATHKCTNKNDNDGDSNSSESESESSSESESESSSESESESSSESEGDTNVQQNDISICHLEKNKDLALATLCSSESTTVHLFKYTYKASNERSQNINL